MKVLKIIQISSRSGDDESKIIKREINDYWRRTTEKGKAKQFAEAFYLLESENGGRLIITQDQASWNPCFIYILKVLKKHEADELHYYFHKN
jgi:hypothetical protein